MYINASKSAFTMKKLHLFLFLFTTTVLFAQTPTYTWQKLNTEPYKGKQDDIFFLNEKQGWYINGFGKIFHTNNGGDSWEMQIEKKGTFFRCIAFVDSLIGFVGTVGTEYFPNVTDTIPLYKTTDGGKTWNPVNYKGPYVKGLCALDIVKEQFINHGEIGYKYHIYGVGRVGTPGNIIVSHDNGVTFTSMDMNKYSPMLFDIKMFNKNEGFACGASDGDLEKSHARIIYTKDGGKTWKTVFESKRGFENTWKCSFPNRNIGYVTIQCYNPDTTVKQQYYVKTMDGGKTWKEYPLIKDYTARSFGVGFMDENIGFIGTMTTGLITTDGGKTWEKTDMGKACNKIRITRDSTGKLYGYAIGVNVMRLKY